MLSFLTSILFRTPPKTNLLNQPLTLPNGVVIPNRLAKAATSETLASYSNNPTEKHI